MKEITIDKPNGYLTDSEGRVCLLFGNWKAGTHTVPDYVDGEPTYVDGPTAHPTGVNEKYEKE